MYNREGTFPKINTLNAELNTICPLLALSGVHHFLHVSRIRVNRNKSRTMCDNLFPGIVAACRWSVESGKLVYSGTFGHVPTCDYMSHRQNESFVPEQQRKRYVSVVYGWRKNERQESGAADKQQVLCEDR